LPDIRSRRKNHALSGLPLRARGGLARRVLLVDLITHSVSCIVVLDSVTGEHLDGTVVRPHWEVHRESLCGLASDSAENLIQELSTYEMRRSESGHVSYGAMSGAAFDDLVTALGLSLFSCVTWGSSSQLLVW
jgi:hypothetical protein